MKNRVIFQKGVAAIEFAILLPVLLAILLGIINYGLLMFNQAVITNAAREGLAGQRFTIRQRWVVPVPILIRRHRPTPVRRLIATRPITFSVSVRR